MQFCLLILSLARELSPEIISETQDNDVLIVGKTEKTGEKNLRRIMIEDYVNTNFNNDISLKQLSRELFLSEKQTERVFKEEMGIGFSDFVAKVRLDAAIYYLKSTNIKVQDIAAKVGYKSYNGFYRLFYNSMGISPKDYRKNERKQAL